MTDESSEALEPWRLAEIAWSSHLRATGHVVTHLHTLTSNTALSQAPLSAVGSTHVRTPDLMTTDGGRARFWEVKFRSRPHIDPLTGAREHWMGADAFADYDKLASDSGCAVTVVLYEAGDALAAGRWLVADLDELRRSGRGVERTGRDGAPVNAWSWPIEVMRIVDGPMVPVDQRSLPVFTDEGGTPARTLDDVEPVERQLRRLGHRVSVASIPDESLVAPLVADPVSGLEAHRRHLDIPDLPRYSVLRIGASGCDLDGTLELLDYGLRLFLITGPDPMGGVDGRGLRGFADARLLEWAELDMDPSPQAWVVDGRSKELANAEIVAALDAADRSGHFNVDQYRVVHESIDGSVLVTAGAGTGKTETMVERLVFLLATGATAMADVSLITFTNDAAREIRARIARTLGLRRRLCPRSVHPVAWLLDLAALEVSTIHTFAKGVIRTSGAAIGLSPDVRVTADTVQFRRILHEELSEPLRSLYAAERAAQIPPIHKWRRHLEAIWDAAGNNGVDVLGRCPGGPGLDGIAWGSSGLTDRNHRYDGIIRSVLLETSRRWSKRCAQRDQLPTTSLVAAAVAALRVSDQLPTVRYMFVDEFQDTDSMQLDLLIELQQRCGVRLFVVGDAKQGVYRFRGAEGNAFAELRDRVESCGLDTLVEHHLHWNFRTHRNLLDSLHPHFAALNERTLLDYRSVDRLSAAVSSTEPSGRPLEIRALPAGAKPADVWADVAAEVVVDWRTSNPNASIAVLGRTNSDAMDVQRTIRERGYQCSIVVGGEFYRSPAVRELLTFLDAVLEPDDDAAVFQLLETRWSGGLLRATETDPAIDGDTLMPWADRFAGIGDYGRLETSDLDPVRRRLRTLADRCQRTPTMEWLVDCIDQLQPHRCARAQSDDFTERERYGRGLDHMLTLLDSDLRDQPITLDRLTADLRLRIATNRSEDEPFDPELVTANGTTTALTVHKAKGLEFDLVLIPRTWIRFGHTSKAVTRTAFVRHPTAPVQLAWQWSDDGGIFAFNVKPGGAAWKIDDEETAREEARLLYVALTRAKARTIAITSGKRPNPDRPRTWSDLLGAVP